VVADTLLCLVFYAGWLASLLYGSFLLLDSWDFLEAYTFMYFRSLSFLSQVFSKITFPPSSNTPLSIMVPDLTPNVGLFWYFFIEIFEQFRVLFLYTFQFHLFVYVLPLSIKLRNNPLFLAFILNGIIGTFKSYPSVGDTALLLGLLPLFQPIFRRTSTLFPIGNPGSDAFPSPLFQTFGTASSL